MWERGLKSVCWNIFRFRSPSFPLWERGLKSINVQVHDQSVLVVPLVGTWIEISYPFMVFCKSESFPLWERGLKLLYQHRGRIRTRRSPCGNVD